MPIAFLQYSLDGAVQTVRSRIQRVVEPEAPEQDVDFPA
jgi:hypothetical protein